MNRFNRTIAIQIDEATELATYLPIVYALPRNENAQPSIWFHMAVSWPQLRAKWG